MSHLPDLAGADWYYLFAAGLLLMMISHAIGWIMGAHHQDRHWQPRCEALRDSLARARKDLADRTSPAPWHPPTNSNVLSN